MNFPFYLNVAAADDDDDDDENPMTRPEVDEIM